MKYIYTENLFVTHADKEAFTVEGFIGNIYVIEDNAASAEWITKHNHITKTKTEAETIVNEASTRLFPAGVVYRDFERGGNHYVEGGIVLP